jgi:glycyl-tRNA synthetase beta chain
MPDLLLEIGCEEIPARMLDAARTELSTVSSLLLVQRLVIPDQTTEESFRGPDNIQGKLITPELMVLSTRSALSTDLSQSFSTPRRIAFFYPGVLAAQEDREEQVPGPAVKVAFKDGKPTPAAEAFVKKVNLPLEKIGRITTPKGEYLSATLLKKGRSAIEVLAETLPKEIASIYWPKNMYWRAGKPERFVRPVRWIVALLDGEIIPLEFAGIKAGNQSRGHRILGPAQVSIASPSQYVATMQGAHVTASAADREFKIRKALDAATRTVPGARWREDAELLKTVVNLTEWPSAILGNFDKQYLSLPEEVLVTVMRDHQKYFAVEDAEHKLAPHFLAVLNTDGDPDGLIRHGNERVLRARFNDARFFWDTDQKIPMTQRVTMLSAVTFQKDLGSYHDKTGRVLSLATDLAMGLRKAGLNVRPDVAADAAQFAKADLTTELVKEFTELQGIIGGLYVQSQGLPGHENDPGFVSGVSDAIYDQYKPGSTEDSAPRTLEGAVLSIADKADSIAGMFALGLVPSGSKDPFALRRQANGIVKTIVEHNLPLKLTHVLADARNGYQVSEAEKKFTLSGEAYVEAVRGFFRERLEFYLRDVLGMAYDVVNATLAAGSDDVVDAVARAEAIKEVRSSADFAPLFIAFKRIKNIIKQAGEKKFAVREADVRFEAAAVESDIWQEMQGIGQSFLSRFGQRDYADALKELARLRAPVDTYFEKVMVMDEDPEVRANRLGVLNYLLVTFNKIADLSELVVETK